MKRLLLLNLLGIISSVTYSQVTNSFPSTGTPTVGGSNYMSIGNRMFFQAKNQDVNGYNRGIVANNLYWDSAQSKWTNGTGASFDFAMLRFESGGNISFFNGPVPDPNARQTFTNSELEAYRRLTIKSNGNIGIGTASPGANLVVNGKARIISNLTIGADEEGQPFFPLYIKAPQAQIAYSVLGQPTDQKIWTTIANGDMFRILTENDDFSAIKEALIIKRSGIDINYVAFPNGNIGIGTTDTKGYKFAVNGSAVFTKVVVKPQASWPDYVFEKNYPLLPLDSVESFISNYKRLPGIPGEQQINKEGIDVGNNQTKLLQKIEELTLYLIEQNKTITELKEQLQQQKNEIQLLQSGLKNKIK